MSTTLPLADRLLTLGQHYLRLGRDQEALKAFTKLSRLPDLDRSIAEDAQAGLADIYFRRNKFKQARRHLHIALARDPGCARYHHLMATTLEEDNITRAAKHYARAVKLAPSVAEYHCDYGLCLLSMAEVDAGLKHLKKAIEQDPDAVEFVRHYAMSLIEADRPEEARRAVLSALFRNSRDPQLKALWQQLRFREVQQAQRRWKVAERMQSRHAVLLPFRPIKKRSPRRKVAEEGGIVRMDGPHHAGQPHFGLQVRKRQT